MSYDLDVAIMGAGTAGMGAYRTASVITDRVLLIEDGPYGTTCARVGCMPSKLLISSAEAAHAVEGAHRFGVHAATPRIDGVQVMDRVKRERDRFVGFVLEDVEGWPERHKRRGRARFVDPHTLDIGGERVTARSIVIATGSRPKVAPELRALGDRLVVNDDVFAWDDLPESVVVFGPGVIGLELGQALHRLGVRVHVLGLRGGVGPLADPEMRAIAEKVFSAEMPLHTQAVIHAVERVGDRVRVRFTSKGQDFDEEFEYALAAVGRAPNVDDIGIETTGLQLGPRGVPLYDPHTMQCGDSHIFIAGDADDDLPILHEASDEGRIAGTNAASFPNVQPGVRRIPLGIVFTDPGIMITGDRLYQHLDDPPIIGRVSFTNQGRSRIMGLNQGALHVYADRATGRFLGAEMVGPRAEHLGHLLAWARQQSLTIDDMLAMPFYHPVIEEGLRTALRDASAQLRAARSQ